MPMLNFNTRVVVTLLSICVLHSTPSSTQAGFISGGPGITTSTEKLGSFTGSFNVTANGSNAATLTIILNNTSPVLNGGFLTAFVFNNPGAFSISFISSTSTTFKTFLSGNNMVSAAPFGDFDFGVTTRNAFEGGGPPQAGLGVGESATFTFAISGTNAENLSDTDFFALKSVGNQPQPFVVRFRGFEDEGSDKVVGLLEQKVVANAVPAPPTLILALGTAGLILAGRFRRRPMNHIAGITPTDCAQ